MRTEYCLTNVADAMAGQIIQCGAQATVYITTGCLHEHLVSGSVCEACLAVLEADDLLCTLCAMSASPHECEVRLLSRETITG